MTRLVVVLVIAASCHPAASDDGLPGPPEIRAHIAKYCPRVVPYFYRIEKGAKLSYAFGTRHMSVSIRRFSSSMWKKLRASRLAVFESAPGRVRKTPLATPKGSLSAQLGDDRWSRFRSLVGKRLADKLEDRSTLEAIVIMESIYEDRELDLDRELVEVARDAKVQTMGLDTDELDSGVAKLFDVAALSRLLDETPDRAALAERAGKSLADYCEGSETVDAKPDAAEQEAFDEHALLTRNRAWAAKLEPVLPEGGVFIVVGRAHLRGPGNLLELLRAQGFTVTRIPE
ncbi:MAG: TraB/GumN family protein [Kofleriaceae bacterium]